MNHMPKFDASHPSPVDEANRRHWNERWGELWRNARGWQAAAFVLLAMNAGTTYWALHQTAQTKWTPPWIVEVDSLRETVAAYRAEQGMAQDPRIIKAELARWVMDVRSVTSDANKQSGQINDAFALMDSSGAAVNVLKQWYEANPKRESAADDTVDVTIESVSPAPGSTTTWNVNWREQRMDLKGNPDGLPTYYYASLGIKIMDPATPRSEAQIQGNPIGLFIEALSWGDRPAGRI